MPDEELFQLAANRRLLDREILSQQIQRMLKDRKGQVLGGKLRLAVAQPANLKDVRPNPDVYRTSMTHFALRCPEKQKNSSQCHRSGRSKCR